MLSKFARILRESLSVDLVAPLILIGVYVAFLVVLRGTIPTPEELLKHAAALYARFGYEIVFLGAFLEACVIINFFIPGTVAVALGAVFARAGEMDLGWAIIFAASGAIFGYIIDYLLGYFGFGKIIKDMGYADVLLKAKTQIEKSVTRTFAVGFIHPNLGSLISLTAGTLRLRFLTFLGLSILSTFVWFSVWAILVFAVGDVFLVLFTKYVWLLILVSLSAWLLYMLYTNKKRKL